MNSDKIYMYIKIYNNNNNIETYTNEWDDEQNIQINNLNKQKHNLRVGKIYIQCFFCDGKFMKSVKWDH